MISIYVIEGPTGLKYVGQTVDPVRRLAEHRRSRREDMPIAAAIRSLGRDNFGLEVVETCETQVDANRAERRWIEELGCLEPDGYNRNLGTGRRAGTAARISAALKGRPVTWAAKISATRKGHSSTPAQVAAMEACRARGLAWQADPVNARARSEGNGRRKLTDDEVRTIRREYRAGRVSQQVLADRFGVAQGVVSRIVRGLAYVWLLEGES